MTAIRKMIGILMTLAALLASYCRAPTAKIEQTPFPAAAEISAQFPLARGTYWRYEGPTKHSEGDSGKGTFRGVEKISRMKWEVVETVTRGHVLIATIRQNDDPEYDHFIIRVGPGKFYEVGYAEQMEKVRSWMNEARYFNDGLIWDDQLMLDLPLFPGKIFGGIQETMRSDRGYCWDVTSGKEVDLSGVAGIPHPQRRMEYRLEERAVGYRKIHDFVPGVGFTRLFYSHNGTPDDSDFRLIEFHPGEKSTSAD